MISMFAKPKIFSLVPILVQLFKVSVNHNSFKLSISYTQTILSNTKSSYYHSKKVGNYN
uniref:Uncharacterized protein n=1 Tax=Solanum lycopersicum TaxID=4081 RepID=A0A3Q7ITN4_SOLLC